MSDPESPLTPESDEVPFVPPVLNPTPTKPTLDFEVIGPDGHSVRGYFVDESAAIACYTERHGAASPHPPQVICHTPDRQPQVYRPDGDSDGDAP